MGAGSHRGERYSKTRGWEALGGVTQRPSLGAVSRKRVQCGSRRYSGCGTLTGGIEAGSLQPLDQVQRQSTFSTSTALEATIRE